VADDVVAEVSVLAGRRLDTAPGDESPWLLGTAVGILRALRSLSRLDQRVLLSRAAGPTKNGPPDGGP